MMALGGEHEASRVYLCSQRYRHGILVPSPHHHRRDGRDGASADRGQRCRSAVAYSQKLVKAQQIAKAPHFAKAPHCKACRPGVSRLERFRFLALAAMKFFML